MPKVELPGCETCGTTDRVFRCRICGQFTCFECTVILPDGEALIGSFIEQTQDCLHKKPDDLVSNPNWEL